MGTNVVGLTDREFMQKLQESIFEDHLQTQRKRIQEREVQKCPCFISTLLILKNAVFWYIMPALFLASRFLS
jgi:hypothetical protein